VSLSCLAAVLLGAAPAVDLRAVRDDAALHVAAVQYARSEGLAFPRVRDRSATGPFAWMFHVVSGRGRIVLVDAGTPAFLDPARGPALRARWNIRYAETLEDALARVGLAPADVTDVVLTHHHWDHSDGVARLPRATVHVHAGEWKLAPAQRLVPASRVATFERFPHRPLPWLELQARPGHTLFHASVRVACREPLHLLGDAPHLPAAGNPPLGREVTGHDPRPFAEGERVALLCGDARDTP
jgi:glyoxylase-like metal-dependent hydrolase (beta-lactamase superfamily II)